MPSNWGPMSTTLPGARGRRFFFQIRFTMAGVGSPSSSERIRTFSRPGGGESTHTWKLKGVSP